jgi:hypothetical protein
MSDDVAGRLRSLAKEYSQGRLALDAYRQQRTVLLDSLMRHAPPIQQRSRHQPSVSDDASTLARAPRSRSRVRGVVLFVCGILALGALASLFFRDRAREESTSSEFRQDTPAGSDRIYSLVAPLLNDPDWTEANVAAINAGLLEEGPRRIAAARNTEWFQRFATRVRQRLLEEQKTRGDDRAAPERSSLAALAVTIGLDSKAPQRPRRSTRGNSPSPHAAASPAPSSGGE